MRKIKNGYEYSSRYYTYKLLYPKDVRTNVRILKLVSLIGSKNKVLDIGCFDGTIGQFLINNKNDLYGIDASREGVDTANKRGIKAKIGNLEEKFDFKDNFFDVCLAGEIIEHIVDTDFFIDEIKRVLKPNGYLVLSTPNVASFGRRLLLLLGKNPYFEASYGFPPEALAGHIRFFTKDLLLSFLKYKGFEIITFTSDVVNFTSSGSLSNKLIADIFPTLGHCLIVKAKLIK